MVRDTGYALEQVYMIHILRLHILHLHMIYIHTGGQTYTSDNATAELCEIWTGLNQLEQNFIHLKITLSSFFLLLFFCFCLF